MACVTKDAKQFKVKTFLMHITFYDSLFLQYPVLHFEKVMLDPMVITVEGTLTPDCIDTNFYSSCCNKLAESKSSSFCQKVNKLGHLADC